MKKKLQLVCDDCGMEIADPCQGELAWAWRDEAMEKVLVVHAPYACPRWMHKTQHLPRHVEKRGTENLHCFMGPSGLLELLERIETGDIPVAMGLELIRRLRVPGYEQYRLFRKEHNASGSEFNLPAKPDGQAFREYLELTNESGRSEGES